MDNPEQKPKDITHQKPSRDSNSLFHTPSESPPPPPETGPQLHSPYQILESLKADLARASDTTEGAQETNILEAKPTTAPSPVLPESLKEHPFEAFFNYLMQKMRKNGVNVALDLLLNELRKIQNINPYCFRDEILAQATKIAIADQQTYLDNISPYNIQIEECLSDGHQRNLALLHLNPASARHSVNVLAIGRELQTMCEYIEIHPELWKTYHQACLIHDVGKAMIPSDELNNPNPLTPGQRLLIDSHEFESLRLIIQVQNLSDLKPPYDLEQILNYMVARHHNYVYTSEMFNKKHADSKEYIPNPSDVLPNHLRETADLFTLLLFLADSFVALGEKRAYREHLLPLSACSSITWDNFNKRPDRLALMMAAEKHGINIKELLENLTIEPNVIHWHQEQATNLVAADKAPKI